MKMVDIQKSLCGGFPKIIAPGRKLLKQGNLMKVPRTGGSSGQPRYFVLFSDMIMYCKLKTQGNLCQNLVLPKNNALECGCMLPLKNCKIETLVGKGVFKLTCQREELILFSLDGAQSSEEWVECIRKAITQHKANSATLRKESSRRDPIKRPDIMKMRRESLGQILLLRKGILTPSKNLHKMVLRSTEKRKFEDLSSPGNSPIVFSPRSKKRPAPIPMEALEKFSPEKKLAKIEEENQVGTPKAASKSKLSAATPTTRSDPPEIANVQIKAKLIKRINRSTSAWKHLSLNRKDRIKHESSLQIFRSPSIYENNQENTTTTAANEPEESMMKKYLSGKLVPLTPSQQPTNVDHLVERKPEVKYEVVPANNTALASNYPLTNYCSVM